MRYDEGRNRIQKTTGMKKLTVKQIFGQNIRENRKKFGLTQQELADAVKMDRVSIVNIERGVHATTIDKIVEICSVLQCSPNDLLPPIPKSSAQRGPVHISFTSKKAREECLNDPEWVAAMNKLITKAHYMKIKK